MRETWWVSCDRMTVKVVTEDRMIVEAAPIVWKFKGQNLKNLLLWIKKFGNPKCVRIA